MKKLAKVFGLLFILTCQCNHLLAGSLFQNLLRSAEKGLKKAIKPQKRTPPLEFILTNGGYLNLLAHNGKYLSLKENGSAYFTANKPKAWELIRVFPLSNNQVALFGVHGKFASGSFGKDEAPMEQAPLLKPWEIFELIKNDDGTFSFKGANGRYMCVLQDGSVYIRAEKIDDWEKIKLEPVYPDLFEELETGKIVALKNYGNGDFLSVNQDENYELRLEAKEAKAWERLRVVTRDMINFSFQAYNGNYLTVDCSDRKNVLRATAEACGVMEKFQIFVGKNPDQVFLKAGNGKFVRINSGVACAVSDEATSLAIKIQPTDYAEEQAEIFAKNGLTCSYTSDYSKVWSSEGLAAQADVMIFRPKVPRGWVFVGDVLNLGSGFPSYSALIIKDSGNETDLIQPLGYEEVWNDKSAKKNCEHVSFWRPIPPEGFVSMGLVATQNHKDPSSLPSMDNFRCVAKKHVVKGFTSLPAWNDRNSGAEKPLSLFVVGRHKDDKSSLPTGTFIHSSFNSAPVGGRGGAAFTDMAPENDLYLAGFEGRSGASIDSLVPIYRSFSDPDKTVKGTYRGGGGGGDFSEIARKGYAVSGISGLATGYVNQIQIHFMKIDGLALDPKTLIMSKKYGGDNGQSFSLGGHGSLFHGVEIRSGGLIDAINLVPLPAQPAWLIAGKTKEELRAEVVEGVTKLYLEQNQEEIEDSVRKEFLKKYPDLKEQENSRQNQSSELEIPQIPDLKEANSDQAEQSFSEKSKDSGSPDSIKTTTQALEKGLQDLRAPSEVFDFLKAVMELLGFEKPKLSLKGDMIILSAVLRLKLSESIKLKFDVYIDVPMQKTKERGVLLRAEVPGEWKNLLGFSGLTLKKIGFGGNLAFNAKKPGKIDPTLYLKGAIDVGLSDPVEMLGAYDPTTPGIDGMIGKLKELSWEEVLKIANFFLRIATQKENASLPTPDFPVDIIEIHNASLMVARKDVANLELEAGTRLGGDFVVDKKNLGTIEVLFAADGTTTAVAKLDEQKIGNLIISAPPGFGQNRGGPVCTIVHSKARNKFSITGIISLGKSEFTFYQEVEDKAKVGISGNLAGVLPLNLQGEAKLKKNSLFPSANMGLEGFVDSSYIGIIQDKVVETARKVPAAGPLLATFGKSIIRIEYISVKASFEDLAKAKLPEVKIKFRIAGKDFNLKLSNISVSKNLEQKLVEDIAEILIKETSSMASEFIKILGKTVEDFSKNILAAANEVADSAVAAFEKSEEALNQAAESISNFSVSAGNTIKNYGESSLKAAKDVGNAVLKGVKKLKFW